VLRIAKQLTKERQDVIRVNRFRDENGSLVEKSGMEGVYGSPAECVS